MSSSKAPCWVRGGSGALGLRGELDVLRCLGIVEGAVAEHGEQDADALAGEAEEDLANCVLSAEGDLS